jgi:PAS domain S-box-containing protein
MKKTENQKRPANGPGDQKVLIETEERFRLILENSPVGKSITGIDGSLRVNKALCDILGYSEKELKDKNWMEITHPDDIKESREVVDRLLKGKKDNERYEKRYIHKKGNIVWTDVSTTLEKDAAGNPLYFITVIIDITEIKKASEKLKISEDRHRSYIELTGQIAWVTNPKGEVVEDIPYFRHFTGLSYDQVKGSGWASALHPDDVAKTIEIWNNAVSSRSSYETEYRLKRHDGVYRDLLAKGSPVFDKNGEILEWVGICTDITEHKQIEEVNKNNEKRFRELIESLPQLFWTCRVEGPCDYLSRQWVDYTGIPEEEQLGYRWLEQLHPEDRDKTVSDWMEKVKTGSRFDIEFRIRKSDGIYHWFKTRAVPMRDADGNIIKWFGSNTDFDEIIKAQEQLKVSSKELEQKVKELDIAIIDLKRSNQELEQFAYVASHDLQEPLRMVSSYTQLLERRYKDQLDQDAKDFIFYAVDGANRMQHLINDLLDYSRVTTRGKPFVKLDLSTVLGHAIANLQKKVQETGAMIVNYDLPFVYGDEVQLVRVFQNLLDNAMKFRGTDPPRINVTAKTIDDKIQISISDNGIGIDKIYTVRVFTIFQRLHNKIEYPGTGIGLAICKRTVERHGGKIWFESEPGKGTTFIFTLNYK